MEEYTLILIKPDGVWRRLVGEILTRFERINSFMLCEMKMLTMTKKMAEDLYKEHVGKPFFSVLIGGMTYAPVIALVLKGPNVVEKCRKLVGSTNSLEAEPGTIRGDFGDGEIIYQNLVHASDSKESAEREILIYFPHFFNERNVR